MDAMQLIKENNATHIVDEAELRALIDRAELVHRAHHPTTVHFERSIFINWTCAIADCKYCFLSTKPKLKADALRSPNSILAEIIICQAMGWKIGYITGGLRVEPKDHLIELMRKINIVLSSTNPGEKIAMNFGPYPPAMIKEFKPYISGMGAAIESFDSELHNFICPSKPLKTLLDTLQTLKEENIPSFITIILGMGEKKDDVFMVIEKIKEYNIQKLQLCFLKPQENTIFSTTPPPNPKYMAWWVSNVRVACPTIDIKVALVSECMDSLHLFLRAGANSFSRFMVFDKLCSDEARTLVDECIAANRKLQGHFMDIPEIDINSLVEKLPFDDERKKIITEKAKGYYQKLQA